MPLQGSRGLGSGVNAFKHPKFSTSKSVPITWSKIRTHSLMVKVQIVDQAVRIQKMTDRMAVA